MYDAWGGCSAQLVDSECFDLATLNPFRYRGYVFDPETNLYYLNTRYYDPETGRFISQDDVSYLDPEHVNGLNLFAYCGNNPVMRTDSQGTSWWTDFWDGFSRVFITVLVVAAVVALTVLTNGIATAITGVIGNGFFASVIGGAVGGAISGAIWGAGLSIISQGMTNGYGSISWSQVGKDTLSGMISGAIAGGVFGGIKHIVRIKVLANRLSGLTKAQENFNKASQAMQDVAIKIKGGAMSSERIAAQLIFDAASQSLNIAQSANSIISKATFTLFQLIQIGFKQIIGGQLNNAIWGA